MRDAGSLDATFSANLSCRMFATEHAVTRFSSGNANSLRRTRYPAQQQPEQCVRQRTEHVLGAGENAFVTGARVDRQSVSETISRRQQ
jgi:hypothetical protein